jgi:hypothetical protein
MRLWHRITKGHYPVWGWVRVGEYLEWRMCLKCQAQRKFDEEEVDISWP